MKSFSALSIITMILAASTAVASVDKIDEAQQATAAPEIVGISSDVGIHEVGWMPMRQYNKAGELVWAGIAFNSLANDGEYLIESVIFQGATPPTGFFLRLYNTSPTGASTLSTLASYEPATANGYAPASQTLYRNSTDWPTLVLNTSHYQITSKTVTITATGAVGPVTNAAVATTSDNTGKLMAYAALSTTRTLASGDSLQVSYTIRLQ